MIKNSGVRIFQPDLFYYGGLIRSLRVAKMAEDKGLNCTPHISGGGLGFLYMGIFASCCSNPGPYQEYKGLTNEFPWESTGNKIKIKFVINFFHNKFFSEMKSFSCANKSLE